MKTLNTTLLSLLIATAIGTITAAHAKATAPERPQTQEQVTMALGFVDKLLTVSSLARIIEDSHFAPALAYLAEARRLNALAQLSLKENNLVSAIAKRDEAIRLAFEAGHLSQMAADRKDKPRNDFESRLRSIQALTQAYASIAKKNAQSELVAQLNKQIEGDLDRADQHRAAGDYVQGRAALDKAYLQVRHAVENIRGGQTLGELSSNGISTSPQQHDYETKLRSINALLEAQQRIADEKANVEQKQQLKRTVSALLNSAADYAAANDYEQAAKTVKQAYQIITASIEQLRGGETLVRTLHFETPEEEYHYELDRNDTYQMLIHMLVEDKKTMDVTERVQQFLDQARALRKLGERQAENGEFDTAIKSLEQSTRNLIFAMRNAGFFIPG
jgi:tetratricopeptide (TPR) repeat protein